LLATGWRRGPRRFSPWGSSDLTAEEKISPIAASAQILVHLRDAWDRSRPDAPFAQQRVTVTVPASFDALAQRLTLEAAAQAGYPAGIGLLEEPQAAFYRWLEAHETEGSLETQLERLRERPHHVLVIDVGGGTTDFSLFQIKLGKNRRSPDIQRVAVSDHLLLGGDNIDLALAHLIEPRLGRAIPFLGSMGTPGRAMPSGQGGRALQPGADRL